MAHNPPLRGVAYEFYVSLVSQSNTKLMQSNPTLAAGDVKVSKDGGALANLATLPAAVASGKLVKVNLSATEMTADNVAVILSDAAGAEWCDLVVNIQTVDAGVPATVVSIATGAINAAAIADNAIDAGALATDAANEIRDAIWNLSPMGREDPNTMSGLVVLASADLWDESLGGHTIAGSAGKALADAAAGGGGSSPAAIADAVWDEAMLDHVLPGTTGLSLITADRGNKIGDSTTAATNLKKAFTGDTYNAAGLTVAAASAVAATVNAKLVDINDVGAFARLVALLKGAVTGLVGSGTNTTTVVTGLGLSSTSGFYVGKTFIATSGANAGQGGKLVVGYDGATKRLTIEALTSAMSVNDTFVLVG